ncbi:DUF2812 domain-containing protein [Anoxynatronum sibiricum]|uniref:DUF2812 domain-containing protein n=1 Tax=Anoxynatronum sibiricum TaxID=210623 RepID=A0ABU9VV57_9CLOT
MDYKAIGIYLEEMAAKGWMLERVGRVVAKFRAIEPRRLKFYVDVFKDEGPLTPANTKESEEYRSLCQASGWTFITSQDYLQYFYSEDDDSVPIQTDEVLEQKIVETTLFKGEILNTSLILIVGIVALAMHFPVRHHHLLSFAGVAVTVLFPILFGALLASTVYSVTRVFKARKNIKRGLPLDKPTLKNAQKRIMAFNGIAMTIVSLIMVAFLVDAYFKPSSVIPIIGPVLGTIIGLGLRYVIKNKSTDKNSGIAYITLVVLAAFFSMAIVSSLLSNRPFDDSNRIDPVPEGYPLVTMMELIETSQQGSLAIREFNRGMSPLTPLHYDYLEVWDFEEESQGVRVRYYNTIHPLFAQMIFDGITEELMRGVKFRGNYYLTKTIVSDEAMKSSWRMDHLALTEDRDELILQKGNKVVHVSGKVNFDDGQIRDIIVNRLFMDNQ